MIKKASILLMTVMLFLSCSNNDDLKLENKKVTLNFIHSWDDTSVTKADFNDVKFTNENGDQLSIERLRYLVSKISLIDQNSNETQLSDYLLVDLGEENNLSFSASKFLLEGTYTLKFNFGFDDTDNQNNYTDLNSASFNVPDMLGGGYHYMQFDGKYTSATNTTPSAFNYHAIKAVDVKFPEDPVRESKDTSFAVSLSNIQVGSSNDVVININMNIAEWFKNPETWDLNTLNTVLMPDYDAQISMNANGKTVFSLK